MRVLGAGLIICLLCAPVAHAADPAPPIVGQDVMGDKSRTGPDGWVQAPVSRNAAPSGRAAGQTQANIKAAPDSRPGPAEGKTLPAGEDPGTPAPTRSSGPGTLDVRSAPAKTGG